MMALDSRVKDGFYAKVFHCIEQGLAVIDPEYNILMANEAYLQQAGLPLEEVLGKECHAVSHHRNRPCYEAGEACAVKMTFETGDSHEVVHTHYDSAGKAIYIKLKSYPIKNETGQIIAVIEVVHDITEKMEQEKQFLQSQKMEAVGQLAGGIAHNFNNSLSVIMGFASLVRNGMAKDDPLRSYIERILEASENAAKLTRNILAFSRKQNAKMAPMKVNEIVSTTLKLLGRIIGEHIQLNVMLSDDDPLVMAETGQIQQVIMNLVTNARDAMAGGGKISIVVSRVEITKETEYLKPGTHVRIDVTDTGHGMSDLTKMKIFEPFFTTKEAGKGTGLGLFMVYGIVRQHGGHIEVDSNLGRGTTFKIYLPENNEKIVSDRSAKEEEWRIAVIGSETILVVEDEEEIRGLVEVFLKGSGYKVFLAEDGDEGIRVFNEHRNEINLVILDMGLPEKNGPAALKEIQKIKPSVRAFFMSGYPDDVITEAISHGSMKLLAKPFTHSDFLKTVRKVLDEK